VGTAEAILASSDECAFLGHPKGFFFLVFTEGWERVFEFHLRCAANQH
jgi:hypothetical protein